MSQKLARRELVVVVAGALIVLGSVAFRIVKSRSEASGADTGSIAQSIERIQRHESARAEVERLRAELEVAIPDGSTGEQESNIRADLNRRAEAKGLRFKSLRRVVEATRGSTGAGKPIKFRLDLEGPFIALLGFMYDLEKSPTPYVMLSLNTVGSSRAAVNAMAQPGMDAAQAAAAQMAAAAASGNSNGMVRVNLTIQSYLWPEGPRTPAPSPSPTPSPTPQVTESPTPQPSPTASPTPSPSPEPPMPLLGEPGAIGGPPPMPGGAALDFNENSTDLVVADLTPGPRKK